VRRRIAELKDLPGVAPHAVSYDLTALPNGPCDAWRARGGVLVTWTADSEASLVRARELADNVIFENVTPLTADGPSGCPVPDAGVGPATEVVDVRTDNSAGLFARAQAVIPGGVNSPVRAFASVGGTPRFVARGEGATLVDADGNRYVDLVNSWGPLLFGHARAEVLAAAEAAMHLGSSFGAPTEGEVRLAEAISEAVPSIEKVRLVNSGTEAGMSAVRLARARPDGPSC
jgi:hypothetical protein